MNIFSHHISRIRNSTDLRLTLRTIDWKAIERTRTPHQYQTDIKVFNSIKRQQKENMSEAKNCGTNLNIY